jgi:hypothetical protein
MEEMLAEFGLIGDGEFKIVTEFASTRPTV